MRGDPGQGDLDERIMDSSVEERVAWAAGKRRSGMLLVWQQVDEQSITDPVEQARFLLRRLYPEMPEAWFTSTIDRLAELHAQGRWPGLQRP